MKKLRKSVPLRKRQYSFAINISSGPFFFFSFLLFFFFLILLWIASSWHLYHVAPGQGPNLCLYIPYKACLAELLLIKCQNSNYHRWWMRKQVRGWLFWTSPHLPGAQEFKQSDCYAAVHGLASYLLIYLLPSRRGRCTLPAFRAGLNELTFWSHTKPCPL